MFYHSLRESVNNFYYDEGLLSFFSEVCQDKELSLIKTANGILRLGGKLHRVNWLVILSKQTKYISLTPFAYQSKFQLHQIFNLEIKTKISEENMNKCVLVLKKKKRTF